MVNRKLQSNKLQQMKEEIILLREELAMAQLEASKIVQVQSYEDSEVGVSKTSKSLQMREAEEKGVDEEVKRDGDGRIKGMECQLAHSQVMLESYSQCLKAVKELLEKMLLKLHHCNTTEADKEDDRVEEVGLRQCIQLLQSCESRTFHAEPGGLDCTTSIVISAQTVSLLRSELEACRKDLCTDEQVFAEKMEEIGELQSACHVLSLEKERAESMWAAAQASEAKLLSQLDQLSQKVTMLERPGVVDDEKVDVICEDVGSIGGGELSACDASLSNDSLEGGGGGGGEACPSSMDMNVLAIERFAATRSLIHGKVKTSNLEVHVHN